MNHRSQAELRSRRAQTACTWVLMPPLCDGSPTWNSAMAAPLSRAAYSSQGPIIQPRLVGPATTSPRRTSCCAHASIPHRMGVTWLQGIAFGSPAIARSKYSNAYMHSAQEGAP